MAQGRLRDIDQAAIAGVTSVLGRFLVTKKQSDIASFKTPGLRNVLVTGPYFHDGSQETLWDVVDHYNKGDGLANPWLDQDIQPLALTESEIPSYVAFLVSLTSLQYNEFWQDLVCQATCSIQSVRRYTRGFGPKPPRQATSVLTRPLLNQFV